MSSLYLSLIAYVADRLGWLSLGQLRNVPTIILAGGIVVATVSSLWQGRRLREWAKMKTLEICYWIPGIDESVQGGRTPP